jgi:ABC-2 type transport system permease protein
MELQAIYTLWLREMIRLFRAKSRIVSILAMPVMWLVLMGTGLNSAIKLEGNTSYISFMAPGIMGMALLFNSIFSGVSVIWDKQFGFLKEILVAPVSRKSIVVGKILGSATVSIMGAFMILIISIILGAIPLANLTIMSMMVLLALMILISFSFVSIGLAIATKLSSMEGFQMIMNFLVMPVFFLSGAFFPIDNLPGWMKILTHLDPLMYGVDGMRGALLGLNSRPIAVDLLVLLVFCVAMVIISGYLFENMGNEK